MLHVLLERGSLCRVFGTCVQKDHDLVPGEEVELRFFQFDVVS